MKGEICPHRGKEGLNGRGDEGIGVRAALQHAAGPWETNQSTIGGGKKEGRKEGRVGRSALPPECVIPLSGLGGDCGGNLWKLRVCNRRKTVCTPDSVGGEGKGAAGACGAPVQ